VKPVVVEIENTEGRWGTVFMRADSGVRMGMGHVMRCLSLAQALRSRGRRVVFISHSEAAAVRSKVEREGCEWVGVERPQPDPADLAQTLKILGEKAQRKERPHWVVLDGYHFTPTYQQAIRHAGHRLLVVDDCNHLSSYHGHVLLNHNAHGEKLRYVHDDDTVLLLGTRYVLLRREFDPFRRWKRSIPDRGQRVLVTLGGSDPDNVTARVVDAMIRLAAGGVKGLEAVVVVGAANPHGPSLDALVRRAKFPVRIVRSPEDLSRLMAWAHCAVSAGGSTCWELSFMGLPALVVEVSANQRPVAEELSAAGVAVSLGVHMDLPVGAYCHTLQTVLSDGPLRRKMSEGGRALVDGLGRGRVAALLDVLEGGQLEGHARLRTVQPQDCRALWALANDPLVRRHSFSGSPIPWEAHVRWFQEKMESPDTCMFVLEVCGVPAGQVRYDLEGHRAVVSISVAPAFRGRGIAAHLLKETAEGACTRLGVGRAWAAVQEHNAASLGTFLKAGFAATGSGREKGRPCRFFEKQFPKAPSRSGP